MVPPEINGTSDEEGFLEDEGQHDEGQYRDSVIMGLRITVFVIGVIGNCAVIFVILALREYKKAITHWYVLQLAIADTLFLLTLPFKVAEDVYDEWRFSGAMCKVKEGVLFLNYYSSVQFLMVMSIDRYVALCHGFSDRLLKFRTTRSAYIITVIVWIVSLALCAPIMSKSDKRGIEPTCKCQYDFQKDVMTHEESCIALGRSGETLRDCIEKFETEGNCAKEDFLHDLMEYDDESSGYPNYGSTYPTSETTDYADSSTDPVYNPECSYSASSDAWTAIILFNFIVMFVVPFIIMSVCYSLIAYRLSRSRFIPGLVAKSQSNTSGRRNSGNQGRKRKLSEASVRAERNRIRVTFVCLILVLLFLVCWLPFHAVHLAKLSGIQGSSDKCALLGTVTAVVVYLNSALNPYIYNCIGTHFRKRFRSAAGSLRTSFRHRTHSVSSGGGTVRYHPKKSSGTKTSNVSFVSKE